MPYISASFSQILKKRIRQQRTSNQTSSPVKGKSLTLDPTPMSTAIMDSRGFKLVEQEYAKLQDCIGDLADTINGTLADQKEEICASHETELAKLNIEIEQLKLEKAKLENSIMTNERANLLENERDWYKKEALHLDKLHEQTKAENKGLKGQLDENKNDNKWMKEQLEKVCALPVL